MKKILASVVVAVMVAAVGLVDMTEQDIKADDIKDNDELKKAEKIIDQELVLGANNVPDEVKTVSDSNADSDKPDNGSKGQKKDSDRKDQPQTKPTKTQEDEEAVNVSVSCENKVYDLNDDIVFAIEVVNVGSKALDLSVADLNDVRDIKLKAGEAAFLPTKTTVSEDDIARGSVINNVVVYSDDGEELGDATAVAKTAEAGFELEIDETWSDPANGTEYDPMEEITVTVTVTNVGNQTNKFAHIYSDAGFMWVIPSIAPGETVVLTEKFIQDPNAGRYVNGDEEDVDDEDVDDEGEEIITPPVQKEPVIEEPKAKTAEPQNEEVQTEEPKAEESAEEAPQTEESSDEAVQEESEE